MSDAVVLLTIALLAGLTLGFIELCARLGGGASDDA